MIQTNNEFRLTFGIVMKCTPDDAEDIIGYAKSKGAHIVFKKVSPYDLWIKEDRR